MSRCLSGLFVLLTLSTIAFAQTSEGPKPPAVERAIALQQAMVNARQLLADHRPADAAALLETQLEQADGNRSFLNLLREAYAEELADLGRSSAPDNTRWAHVRQRFALLGGSIPTAAPSTAPAIARSAAPEEPVERAAPGSSPPAVPELPSDRGSARKAAEAFQQGKFADAARLFADAGRSASLSAEESAAWSYCRIQLAAERLKAPALDALTVVGIEREITHSLALASANPKLQELGQGLIAAARARRGVTQEQPATPTPDPTAIAVGGDAIETASFRVRSQGAREATEAVSKVVEASRKGAFERWSGPVTGGWEPKCEIVLHATSDDYARATGQPATGLGHATIRFANGRVVERRIDLRADEAGLVENTLPRELTHVVLADLFPMRPPPRWAEAGIAVLASSSAEVERYSRTLSRCAQKNELLPVANLLEMKDFPAAERITGFYCESVSLVEFLVKLRGERNFTIFLRDTQRYGVASALKKTYGIDGPTALEQRWRQYAFTTSRAQAP